VEYIEFTMTIPKIEILGVSPDKERLANL